MERRRFLQMLGLAPVAMVATALPAAALTLRYHAGGMVTLTKGEFPAIMQPGESVLSGIVKENTQAYETSLRAIEDRVADDLHGPTFDNADDLIADLHSD